MMKMVRTDGTDGTISYFDRVVFEAGGTAGDVNGDIMVIYPADDGSLWSMIEEDEEEESDDEMDFDSDEEASTFRQRVMTTHQIVLKRTI